MRYRSLSHLLLLFLLLVPRQAAAAPTVVATIKPLHALAAGVMAGIGEVELLLSGGSSPHSHSLRPSQMRSLLEADLVIWIGPELESFLGRPLAGMASERLVTGSKVRGIGVLPARAGGSWGEESHEHGAGHRHDEEIDPHLWLDPENAQILTDEIARRLGLLDPANAGAYLENAAKLKKRLDNLDRRLARRLAGLQTARYLVFHDAYQYFEAHFGLQPVGALAVHPERAPGARRISELRALLREEGAQCVFSEPQFEPRLVATILEGTGIRNAVLDPLGADLKPGVDAYFDLLEHLADQLVGCLAGQDRQNRLD